MDQPAKGVVLAFLSLSLVQCLYLLTKYRKPISDVLQYNQTKSEKYNPIHEFANPHVHIWDLTKPMHVKNICIKMRMSPHPWICLHPFKIDPIISLSIRRDGAFELKCLALFIAMIQLYPEAQVIDIGGNIGQFTLVAAKLGRRVVAVEPLTKNARLLARSCQINNFTDSVTLVHNGLRDTRSVMPFYFYKGNPGATRLRGDPLLDGTTRRNMLLGVNATQTILMDDLLPYCQFDTAILKMDIEGYEGRAIYHGKQIFDHIKVPYILMEWVLLSRWQNSYAEVETYFVNDMLQFLEHRGYTPLNPTANLKPLRNNHGSEWPSTIIWKHKDARKLIFN